MIRQASSLEGKIITIESKKMGGVWLTCRKVLTLKYCFMSAIGAAIAPFHSSSRLAERHLLFCVLQLRNTAKWLERTMRGGEQDAA